VLALVAAMTPAIRERGGHKQKRARNNNALPPDSVDVSEVSPLATALIIRWAEGQLSAVDVQELASLAVMSGASDAEVQWLASIGAHGNNTSHCSRALYAKYCKDMDLPERYVVNVPLREKGNKEASLDIGISILLPHDWFFCLGKAGKNAEFMGIPEIETWWQGSSVRNPKFFQHPCLDKDYKHKGLPYIMHGDGAKLHDRDSLLTISMKPLLGKSGFKDSHWFIAALPKSVATNAAWTKIWAVIAWSMDAIAAGVHPHTDENGNPWPLRSDRASLAGKPLMPGGLFGVMWGMTGDLDYFMKDLGLPYHSSLKFCWRCDCDRSAKPWNDFRRSAAWRATVFTPLQVRNRELDLPLFQASEMSPLMLMFDVMHVLDLGICAHVIANILWTMVYMDMASPDKHSCFETLWERMRELYSQHNLSYAISKFELKQIIDPKSPNADYPQLRQVRAAETRHLLKVVAALAEERDSGSQMHRHRTIMIKSLVAFYDVMENNGYYIKAEDKVVFLDSLAQFQLHYQWLAKTSMELGQNLWSVVPKFHFFEHLAEQGTWENPRMFWVYTGEDFVGRLCRIAHFVLPGKATHGLTAFLIERYLIGFQLRRTRLDQ
jgi:hypothetical protein